MKPVKLRFMMLPIARLYRPTLIVLGLLAGACSTQSAAPVIFDQAASTQIFAEHVKALAADRMEGRSPSSVGEARTLEYLQGVYKSIGLEPVEGSYLQRVPLVAVTATNISDLQISNETTTLDLEFGRDMMVWTKQLVSQSALDASEIVFAGYGIVAPEHGWNDYADLDVKGKTVMVLVNDPGFATQDPAIFNGNSMTYYGRWTYKYEEAARQGASGVLIIHETAAAGYPWQVVTGSWAGEQFDLVAADKNLSRAAVEGWISQRAAERVLESVGLEFKTLRAAAAQRGFRGQSLSLAANVNFDNTVRESESYNVVGVLQGTTHGDEYHIYTAHWDHLGMAPAGEDRVFNGAQDNAAGVAMMLTIAEALASQPQPERSVVFLAVTAEESGLLGSAWYGANPLFPLEKTASAINLDAPLMLGPTRDVSVVGFGSSDLEAMLEPYVQAQGRVLAQEPTPEKGFFYRSDHFNFSKRGVPVLYAKSGTDHREKGKAYGDEWNRLWVAQRYHKVADEFDPNWDLRGVGEDMELFFRLGLEIVNSRRWPAWNDGNEFKAIREATSAARQ